jgi:transcriptional regulator with XRE-family HTH domain
MAQTRLKQLREEAVLTVHELAEASGVSDDTISKIENGQRVARPSTLRKLAQVLNVSPQELRRPAKTEELAGTGKGEAPRGAGLSEAGSFHKDAETFNGLADLLRWQLARVQPEQLPSLVHQGIVVANWAAQKKRQEVDPLLDHALEEELAAAQEVEKALSAIEDALYAIGDEAKRQNAAIAAGVEDQLAVLRRRRRAG